jgi:hypothetical protein
MSRALSCGRSADRRKVAEPAILNHLDDDLAFGTPGFEVSPSLFGGFERVATVAPMCFAS